MKRGQPHKTINPSPARQAHDGDFAGDRSQEPADLLRFDILAKLGEGGVAAVYKVLDRKSETVRALKVLKQELISDIQAVERFQDEFRILRHLHHPGLPEMYDYGINEEGTPYIVMEFIDGEPLDEYCAENPDDLRLLLYEITEALSFIHTHNLLHLDIKPDNILVRRTKAYGRGEKPEAVLIDFGMSYRRDAAGEVTVSGTPAYMPPEIIRKEEHPTRAADYYSLGVMIYELIEERVPFEGSLEEVLRAHLRDEITFGRETVEFTDLYPRVRELMSKEITPRLEGFEAFRRELAARESEEVPPLERAYGMGYIESLGMIGKQDIWEDLKNWVETTAQRLEERIEERTRAEKMPALETDLKTEEDSSITTGFDLIKDIEEKRRAREDIGRPKHKPKGPIKDAPRTIMITGTEGSGKSHLADVYRGECLLRGMDVWVLGEGGDYQRLVSEHFDAETGTPAKEIPTVDPKSLIIDRHVRGWERLLKGGRKSGSVLIIDGYQKATDEEKEFLEYTCKRLQLVLNEEKEPGVFLAVTDRSPILPGRLKTILPKGEKRKHYIVPSPSTKDIEAILDGFHGQMGGADDRKQLGEYLKQNQDSSGSIIEAMKQAAVQNSLVRERGRWRFSWTSKIRKRNIKRESRNYYRVLYHELGDNERDVISWLSCRREPIYKSDLLEISGIPLHTLDASFERMKPYRLIDLTKEGGKESISIISGTAADGLYESISGADAKRINETYIAYYEKRLEELYKSGKRKRSRIRVDPADLKSYARTCELLAIHYDRVGKSRISLLMRVRTLRALKELNDLFGLRRLCEAGIKEARALRGKYWKPRRWHIERYFLKEWIEAEWLVDNFQSIASLVRENIIKKKREIADLPLGSYYRYGMSLRSTGAYEQCAKLISVQKHGRHAISPQHNAITLLIEAALLNNLSKYKESVVILNNLNHYRKYLSDNIICRIDMYFMLNYHHLGDNNNYTIFLIKVKNLALASKFSNEVLFLYFHEIKALVNQAKYNSAKIIFRRAVSLASKKKMYHRLCSMYLLLSGIYYEEGDYEKAIKILNKSAELAANLGLIQTTIQCKQRISYNLENMGSWGSAIISSEETRFAAIRNKQHEYYYKCNIDLLNLYTKIKSNKAHLFRDICNRLRDKNQDKSTIALHKYTLGKYFDTFHDRTRAIVEYKEAKSLYSSIGYKDDSIRSVIKLINTYLDIGNYEQALQEIEETKYEIKVIESKDLIGDYWACVLKYNYIKRENKDILLKNLKLCEDLIKKARNITVLLRMSVMIFRAYSRLGEILKALSYFKMYQDNMKTIVNQLENDDSIDSFMSNNNYAQLLREAKIVIRKQNKIS